MSNADGMGDWGDAVERRREERQLACYPADVKAGDEDVLAVIRDISITGALLFTQEQQEPGQQLLLALHMNGDEQEGVPVRANVVRCTRRDSGGLWRYSVAVAFEAPIEAQRPWIADLLKRLPPIPVGDP